MSGTVRNSVKALSLLLVAACTRSNNMSGDHSGHESMASASSASAAAVPSNDTSIPPDGASAKNRLASSPRHGEWVMIQTGTDNQKDSVRAWVVYPERSTKAPVVVVVHEIFGLSTWVRAVADQLAAAGFIAIAPDLLTGKKIPQVSPDSMNVDSAMVAIRTLDPKDVQRQLSAVAKYGMALPAALPKYGIVGFCWGGGVSFAHAAAAPKLGASVVYYGTSPSKEQLATVQAPVLGFYGGEDARVTSTIPPADSALKARGKTYEHNVFDGAGHGFLRAQSDHNGANLAASKQAWPKTIAWFHKYLDS